MGVRVGVDVGGTFTKAVALDGDARVVARAVVPTTHSHADGVAAGVVEVVRLIAAELAAAGQGPDAIELVTHSTTQAALAAVYVAGAVYMFGIRRHTQKPPARSQGERVPTHAPAAAPAPASARH